MAFIFGTEEAQVRGQQSDATETWSCHKFSNYSSHPCCFVPGPVIPGFRGTHTLKAPRTQQECRRDVQNARLGDIMKGTVSGLCLVGWHPRLEKATLSQMKHGPPFHSLTVMPQWISSENLVHNFGVQCTACLQVEQIWLRARLGLKP